MQCKKCGYKSWLKFNPQGDYKGQFTWCCNNYNCKNESLYDPPVNRFDFASNDFIPILDTFNRIQLNEKIAIELEIKVQMVEILNHFISCRWGAHFNILFDKIISPYLDNTYVLDYVLKSETIKDVGMKGRTGAKIYPELMTYLKRVSSEKIQKYLKYEFG
jgi:hypothetical protein